MIAGRNRPPQLVKTLPAIYRAFPAVALLAGLRPATVWACAACYGQSDSPLAAGMDWGIFSLLVVIVAVLGGIATFFVFLARRAAATPVAVPSGSWQAQPGSAVVTALPHRAARRRLFAARLLRNCSGRSRLAGFRLSGGFQPSLGIRISGFGSGHRTTRRNPF